MQLGAAAGPHGIDLSSTGHLQINNTYRNGAQVVKHATGIICYRPALVYPISVPNYKSFQKYWRVNIFQV